MNPNDASHRILTLSAQAIGGGVIDIIQRDVQIEMLNARIAELQAQLAAKEAPETPAPKGK